MKFHPRFICRRALSRVRRRERATLGQRSRDENIALGENTRKRPPRWMASPMLPAASFPSRYRASRCRAISERWLGQQRSGKRPLLWRGGRRGIGPHQRASIPMGGRRSRLRLVSGLACWAEWVGSIKMWQCLEGFGGRRQGRRLCNAACWALQLLPLLWMGGLLVGPRLIWLLHRPGRVAAAVGRQTPPQPLPRSLMSPYRVPPPRQQMQLGSMELSARCAAADLEGGGVAAARSCKILRPGARRSVHRTIVEASGAGAGIA